MCQCGVYLVGPWYETIFNNFKIAKVAQNCVKVKVFAAASSLNADEKFRFLFSLHLLYAFYAHSNIQGFNTPR